MPRYGNSSNLSPPPPVRSVLPWLRCSQTTLLVMSRRRKTIKMEVLTTSMNRYIFFISFSSVICDTRYIYQVLNCPGQERLALVPLHLKHPQLPNIHPPLPALPQLQAVPPLPPARYKLVHPPPANLPWGLRARAMNLAATLSTRFSIKARLLPETWVHPL